MLPEGGGAPAAQPGGLDLTPSAEEAEEAREGDAQLLLVSMQEVTS